MNQHVGRLFRWIYDLRLDNRFTLKARPIQATDLEEFVDLYLPTATQTAEDRLQAQRERERMAAARDHRMALYRAGFS